MDQKQSGGPGFPASGSLLLITLIFGALFIAQHPFHGQRPSVDTKDIDSSVDHNYVNARLWEDPFTAIQKKQYKISLPHHHRSGVPKAGIKGKRTGNRTTVLGIMVFGGSYFENIEWRTRCRYAALSALGSLSYVPEDPEHLSFIRFNDSDGTGEENNDAKLPRTVPYEWFEQESCGQDSKSAGRVLVLWLNDDAFRPKPLKSIAVLKKRLLQDGLMKKDTDFIIIGPGGSTNLRAMLKEVRENSQNPYWKSLEGTSIYSPFATASQTVLGIDTPKPEIPHIRLLRTIHSDDMLCRELVQELKRRGIDPATAHIALISEWDTFYGRELPASFMNAVKRYSGCRACNNIYQYTYMRGIDGIVPGKGSIKGNGADNNKEKKSSEEIERPVGRSQFDYLRRLGVMLREKNRIFKHNADLFGLQKRLGILWGYQIPKSDNSIESCSESDINGQARALFGCDNAFKAFGILGSDVYDKLLVMEALHGIFPNAVFFTTDLDARLLHPANIEWTRNLVVVSSLGLSLDEKYQKGIPPFRSVYQTSLFLAVQTALGHVRHLIDQKQMNIMLGRPRIFEVGRHGAVDLSMEYSGKDVHPLNKPKQRPLAIMLIIAVAGGISALYALAKRFPVRLKKNNPAFNTSLHQSCNVDGVPAFYWKALLLYLALCAVFIWIVASCRPIGEEPLLMFDGVSIWPSLFLRMAAAGVSVFSVFVCIYTMKKNIRMISETFIISSHGKNGKSAQGYQNNLMLWKEYITMNTPAARSKRVLIITLLYFILCFLMVHMDKPFVPFRGTISAIMDKLTIFVTIPAMLFLIMWVMDIAKTTSRFITAFANQSEKMHGWNDETIKQLSNDLKVPASCIGSWFNIRLVAEHTDAISHLVYLPVVVMVIMLASRLRFFDRWDMPFGLALVIVVTMIQVFYWPAKIRQSAERLRSKLLQKFQEEKITQAGLSNHTGIDQLDIMLDYVRNLNKGAFLPFSRQHWVRAVAMAISGSGSFAILQSFPFLQ